MLVPVQLCTDALREAARLNPSAPPELSQDSAIHTRVTVQRSHTLSEGWGVNPCLLSV